MGDVSKEGMACCNLGSDYNKLGDFKKALHFHERCLQIARKVGDVSMEGVAYGNLGSDYHEIGDYKKALHCNERLLEIARKVGDVLSEGTAYGNLGDDYYKLRDFKQAIQDCTVQSSTFGLNAELSQSQVKFHWNPKFRILFFLSQNS